MTFPAYITDGTPPPQIGPDYNSLRLISVVGGTTAEQLRTLKLAALHRASTENPVSQMRVYTDSPDTWLITGFSDLRPLSALAHGIAELPEVTIVDTLDTTSPDMVEIIEHLKASVRPTQLLAVSYATNHDVTHNADLVHWLGLDFTTRKTG